MTLLAGNCRSRSFSRWTTQLLWRYRQQQRVSMSSTTNGANDNTGTTSAATTTTKLHHAPATQKSHRDKSGPLRSIIQSSSCIHSPIPVNYHRSNDVLQKLIQTRVWERDTYMAKNSIAAQELSSLSSSFSISSYFSSWWEILQMGFKFRIPTPQELDREFPIRPIQWEQIQTYHTGTTAHQQNHRGTERADVTTTNARTTTTHPTTTTNRRKMMQVTWLGHSTLLIQYPNGTNVLTDPIFSPYCSPTPQWFGPQRFRPTPCTLIELLQHISIDLVLISHNHYDHLDFPTIQALYQQNPDRTQFVVPLGLQHWLQRYIHPNIQTYELDWYEYMIHPTTMTTATQPQPSPSATSTATSHQEATLQIRSVPMKHWSSRYGYDRDRTLWCGYSLEFIPPSPSCGTDNNGSNKTKLNDIDVGDVPESAAASKFLFSGDTAYFDRMTDCVLPVVPKDRADSSSSSTNDNPSKYHFDVAAIPIGAYEPRPWMYHNHMNVAEAIRMKDDLSCHFAIPIHWGTFPLTIESVLEPRDKLLQLMEHRDDAHTFLPWSIGETKQYHR